MSYPIVTLKDDVLSLGVNVESLILENSGNIIPVVITGAVSDSLLRGMFPVSLSPELYNIWQLEGHAVANGGIIELDSAHKPTLLLDKGIDQKGGVISIQSPLSLDDLKEGLFSSKIRICTSSIRIRCGRRTMAVLADQIAAEKDDLVFCSITADGSYFCTDQKSFNAEYKDQNCRCFAV